ncbi:MAG TPA: hypothetical protein VI410_05035 [Anaerolineales bacterium]|jgi:hypothetical protein|nr:hypothetical protein [Anaerolineales bacterium]
MDRGNRSRLGTGIILVLLGLWFLAVRISPNLGKWAEGNLGWPVIVIGVGLAMLLMGIVTGGYGLAVPASIVAGIGGLLYWQNATGNWESWAYAWALIPGFVGIGVGLMGLLEGKRGEALRSGGWLILISLVMFFVFGSFLGGGSLLGPYWPVLLIGLGALLLGQSILGSRRGPKEE